jgi:hypothetical protein
MKLTAKLLVLNGNLSVLGLITTIFCKCGYLPRLIAAGTGSRFFLIKTLMLLNVLFTLVKNEMEPVMVTNVLKNVTTIHTGTQLHSSILFT